tara:strand:+ start:378 stop:581 length:204 start_codon:yes stop_codon:yes gene_type:complete
MRERERKSDERKREKSRPRVLTAAESRDVLNPISLHYIHHRFARLNQSGERKREREKETIVGAVSTF